MLGGAVATLSAAASAVAPAGIGPTVLLLALLGVGLGLFIPANNTAIMAAVPGRLSATAGGMVNMTRGAGTALGIAMVTLALHATATVTGGARIAFAALAVAALVATATGTTARGPATADRG